MLKGHVIVFSRRKIELRIIEYLKNRGKATDKELYEILSKEFGISYNQLLAIVMQLEIVGLINVYVGKDYMIAPKKF